MLEFREEQSISFSKLVLFLLQLAPTLANYSNQQVTPKIQRIGAVDDLDKACSHLYALRNDLDMRHHGSCLGSRVAYFGVCFRCCYLCVASIHFDCDSGANSQKFTTPALTGFIERDGRELFVRQHSFGDSKISA